MVGTEKTADYKSAGTTQLLDETTIAKNKIGRLQICRNNAKNGGPEQLLYRDGGGVRKTKKGLEITAHAYVPEDESLQLVGGLADGAATVVGEFFVLKVYEQSQ